MICYICGKPIHDSVAGLLYALNVEATPPRLTNIFIYHNNTLPATASIFDNSFTPKDIHESACASGMTKSVSELKKSAYRKKHTTLIYEHAITDLNRFIVLLEEFYPQESWDSQPKQVAEEIHNALPIQAVTPIMPEETNIVLTVQHMESLLSIMKYSRTPLGKYLFVLPCNIPDHVTLSQGNLNLEPTEYRNLFAKTKLKIPKSVAVGYHKYGSDFLEITIELTKLAYHQKHKWTVHQISDFLQQQLNQNQERAQNLQKLLEIIKTSQGLQWLLGSLDELKKGIINALQIKVRQQKILL